MNVKDIKFEKEMLEFLSSESPKVKRLLLLLTPLFNLEVRPNILNVKGLKFEKEMLKCLSSEGPKAKHLPQLLRPFFRGPTQHLEC